MALLGEEGIGYELAIKLESSGGWRAWLGDSHYTQMAPHLTTSSAWKKFMSNAEGDGIRSNAQLDLQLRVRALLFDKATAALHLRSSSSSLASFHPSHLQLHADDLYYSLEEDVDDWHRLKAEGTLTAKALQMKLLQRQLSQQMYLLQPQNVNLTTQPLQWDKARRKQPLTPRSSGRKLEKDRSTGDIKLETSNDFAVDCKVAAPPVPQHHAQWQQQQQQQSIQGCHHPQSIPQFKQHSLLQLPQIPQQSLFSRESVQIRTQPVKVEGFQELMGGDVSLKETEDEIGRTLISPRKL
ncbi:hypothetical protein KI387_001919 [Taxus chinensis]|uniref:Uncharacterized protein n=1 Tax=Taxus chinensis TaxID=29808 RepID=A0AA38LNA1_TAXCH|nr:hypothetical protein KI387_001919 [Taxus chinensis]